MIPVSPHTGSVSTAETRGAPLARTRGAADQGFAGILDSIADVPGNARRFDGTAIRENAERFNERGFFADAGAVIGPRMPLLRKADQRADREEEGAMTSFVKPETPAVVAGSDSAGVDASVPRSSGFLRHASRDRPGAARHTAAELHVSDTSAPLSPTSTLFGGTAAGRDGGTDAPAASRSVRVAPATQPHDEDGANSAVSVTLDAAEGIVLVKTGAYRLTEPEAELLRADIAALLRRHGLVLDDLKLNGRSMTQNDPQRG
ncbi:hypothetical protein [Sphingomonas sp. DT-204]|uniref:hypothetical protein n=1 Tax=Sphingomonas sp. DT-204 TaxID=3396166 RepID=UPI003F1A8BA2